MATITKIPADDIRVGDHIAATKGEATDGKHYPVTEISEGPKARYFTFETGAKIRPKRTTKVWVVLENDDPRAGNGGGTPEARQNLEDRIAQAEAGAYEGALDAVMTKLEGRGVEMTNVAWTALWQEDDQRIRAIECAAGGHRGLRGDALQHYIVTGEGISAQAAKAESTRKASSGRHTPRGPKAGSMTSAMVEVLRGRRKAMTAKELWAEIQRRGLWASPKGKTPDATIGAKLSTEAKKDSGLFERVAPGHYLLRSSK